MEDLLIIYITGVILTLVLAIVYLTINLVRDKINMFNKLNIWLTVIVYSIFSYIGLIIVIYCLYTVLFNYKWRTL